MRLVLCSPTCSNSHLGICSSGGSLTAIEINELDALITVQELLEQVINDVCTLWASIFPPTINISPFLFPSHSPLLSMPMPTSPLLPNWPQMWRTQCVESRPKTMMTVIWAQVNIFCIVTYNWLTFSLYALGFYLILPNWMSLLPWALCACGVDTATWTAHLTCCHKHSLLMGIGCTTTQHQHHQHQHQHQLQWPTLTTPNPTQTL